MKIKPYFYKIAILALLGLGATTSNSRKKENTQVGPHRYDLFNVSYNFSENLELSQAVSRALVDGCIYGYKLKIVDKEIKSVAETRRTSGFGWSSDTEIGFYNLYTKSSNKRILDHIAANRQLLPRVFEHEKWHIHNRKADIFSASLSESKRAENAIDNELSAYTLDETVGGGHIDSAMLRGIGRYLHAYKNCYKNNVLKYAKNPSAYKNKLRVANHKDYMYEFAGGKISDSVWARRDFVVDSLIRDLKIVR